MSELRLPLVGADPGPRTFVIDTNVLLYDPRAIFVFQEHDLVIPMTVIEEIDQFKKDLSEVGRNARMVSRYLDRMREKGSLREGVITDGGGRIRVDSRPAHHLGSREQRQPDPAQRPASAA